jgi:hypothetical protein
VSAVCISILTFLLAGIGAFGPYVQSTAGGFPGQSGSSGYLFGYWYSYLYIYGQSISEGGLVKGCQNARYMTTQCECLIAAASMAVIAWIVSLLASVTACVAGIRRFGAGLSIFGAICALVSFVIYVAGVDSSFQNISAGWPCEVAAFVFFVIQTILFVRVVKPL